MYQKGENHIDEIKFPVNKDILVAFQANFLNSLFHVDYMFPRDVNCGINSLLCSTEQMLYLRSPSQNLEALPGKWPGSGPRTGFLKQNKGILSKQKLWQVDCCVSVAALNMTLRQNLWHFPAGALNDIEEQSHAF